MGEPVERALREDRVVEERDPLLDRAVARDDRRRTSVALEDHLVEVTRLLRGQAAQPEVVDDEEVRRKESADRSLGRVIGARLVQPCEETIGAQEQHGTSRATRRMAERAGEEGLADADRPEEDHVLVPLDEAEPEEVLHAVAIEGDGGIPVEAFERLLLLEAGPVQPQGEILVVAPIDLVLEHELEEVELRKLRLPGVGDAIGQRRQQPRELQAFEMRLERLADLHGSPWPASRHG